MTFQSQAPFPCYSSSTAATDTSEGERELADGERSRAGAFPSADPIGSCSHPALSPAEHRGHLSLDFRSLC